MNTRSLRLGAVAAILGGLITQVSGAVHPVETNTIFDAAVHMREIAENPRWSAIFLGFSIGFLLMLVGLTAVLRAADDSPWAEAVRQICAATTAVALVFFIVDGFGAKTIALATTASNGNEAVVAAAAAYDRFGRMFFGQWTLLCWGLVPVLCGVTVFRGGGLNRWLGVLPIASGLSGLSVGVIHDFYDFSLGLLPFFYAAVAGFNLWLVIMGVTLWRKSSPAATPA